MGFCVDGSIALLNNIKTQLLITKSSIKIKTYNSHRFYFIFYP
jgi:hypothetical protein